jgi:hypothetical protein
MSAILAEKQIPTIRKQIATMLAIRKLRWEERSICEESHLSIRDFRQVNQRPINHNTQERLYSVATSSGVSSKFDLMITVGRKRKFHSETNGALPIAATPKDKKPVSCPFLQREHIAISRFEIETKHPKITHATPGLRCSEIGK